MLRPYGSMVIYSLLILLAVALYGLIHSVLASWGVKASLRHRFGPAFDRYYRLSFNIFGTVSLVPVLVLTVLLPDRRLYAVPFPWSLSLLALQGLALFALAIGVMQTGASSFLGFQQLFVTQPVKRKLVTWGLYRWVRHPLYGAGIVFLWATPMMTNNLFFLFLGLTAYLVIGAMFEERKLLREYGAAYAHYREQTPMFVPGVKGLRRQ
jgi:protein-S-isoprenylcysteine O-methyltransferase Ste14